MKWIYFPLLAATLLFGCAKAKDPEFRRIENFSVKKLGFAEGTLGFHTTYYNPNNFGVTVKEAATDVYIDSIFLGKFTQENAVSVGRKAEFSIPLSGVVSLATLLKLDLKDIDKREVLVRAQGSVKVGKAGIWVDKPFTYEGRHRLGDIQLGDLKF